MEYWETDIEFNFLNEEVKEFTSRRNWNVVNVKSPSYLKQKTIEY